MILQIGCFNFSLQEKNPGRKVTETNKHLIAKSNLNSCTYIYIFNSNFNNKDSRSLCRDYFWYFRITYKLLIHESIEHVIRKFPSSLYVIKIIINNILYQIMRGINFYLKILHETFMSHIKYHFFNNKNLNFIE